MNPARALLRTLLVACAAVVLVLTGCASLPMDGPVGTSAPSASSDAQPIIFDPPGPAAGASAEEIIEGFFRAGIAPQNDYNVAREYLTAETARDWRATTRTLVHESDPNVLENDDGSFTVEVVVTAEIDEHGINSRRPAGSTESLDLELEQVDGEWRISGVPDGTMVEEGNFSVLYSAYPLYFYDSTYTYAVADYRWFASRQGLAASIVESLLAGPAPYLQGAVSSAFPDGSRLSRPTVPVESGRATVDLVGTAFEGTTELHRQQMQQQLQLTLAGVSNIGSVTMTTDQREVSLGDPAPDFVQAVVDPSVPNTLISIVDNSLAYYHGNAPVRVTNIDDVSGFGPRFPAMAPGGTRFAFLDEKFARLVTIDESGRARVAVEGTRLTAPSIDIHGWTWTVDHAGAPRVLAVPAGAGRDAPVREIAADWLEGSTVSSLRISRDGVRAAVVARTDGETNVFISGVLRDSDGVPRGLTEPLELDPSVPVGKVVWDSGQSVIVMQPDNDSIVEAERLALNGSSATFPPLLGLTGIAAGPGERRLVYAETPEGIFTRVGTSVWNKQDARARDLAYPG